MLSPVKSLASMKHGDIFVLHPDDERVMKRSADINNGNKKKSQFQHGVTCKIDKSFQAICIKLAIVKHMQITK